MDPEYLVTESTYSLCYSYILVIYIIYVSVYCFLVHKIFVYLCGLVYSAS